MGVTSITRIENHSGSNITLLNRELPDSTARLGWLSPGQGASVDVHVPWAPNAGDFPVHRLEVHVDGQPRFWIWQAARSDGDYVRFSTDDSWHDPGEHAHGVAAVDGNRTLVVRDGCFELTDFPLDLLAGLRDVVGILGYRLCDQQPANPDRASIPSVPRRAAAAFSMAGIASDTFRRGDADARFLYRDEGKRYDFEIVDGVVTAIHPDGTRTPLTTAISYERRRAGERTAAPPFDLIAANGGRVIAKARGFDRFYFTTMDEMFVRERGGGNRTVPSTFFKLDPECNQPTARATDLTRHLDGCFGEHPAAERFPLFRLLLEQNLVDLMVVALEPRVWHLIDGRTPVGAASLEVMGIELVRRMLAAADALPSLPGLNEIKEALAAFRTDLGQRQRRLQESGPAQSAPPGGLPTYSHVSFCRDASTITLPSIDFRKVLDVGIGHVHWHEQYARITGGELQPLRTGRIFPEPLPPIGYAELYRAVNGPIRDGDGYIDGTCNFYILVELRGGGYALLYLDEQMYFTQRWRLCSPEDFGGGGLALVVALNEDPTRNPPLYTWRADTYWDPFRSGHIGPRSRLAVSRQVLLVTGEDPERHEARIYSMNFSHGTMDRTWRWRALPAPALTYDPAATNGADPVVPRDGGDCVFPQTIRLREDLTLHLMGARRLPDGSVEPGHWYQRYLPANNQLVPPAADLVASAQPREGYSHHWKFLPEATFRRADRFSHLGVHDAVDSRTQYYPLAQPSAAVEQVLTSSSGPWIDIDRQLFVRAWKFWWAAPLRVPAVDVDVLKGYLGPPAKRPPSIFNPDTMLRIVKRGSRWVAMHWDKRDDDLMPFDDLPKTVRLRNGERTVEVTLQPNTFVESPPAVRRAHFWWEKSGEAVVAFTAPQVPASAARDNVWRVRMAALEPDAADPTRVGRVVWLLDVEREGRFTVDAEGYHRFRWSPSVAERAALTTYCSPTGEARYATSMWFEDTVGHAAVPEEVRWSPPPVMRVEASPSTVPLGVPVQMTVSATDVHTSSQVAGTVLVDGIPIAPTGAPFTYTFTTHTEREFDPERRVWITTVVEPVVTVAAADYREMSLELTFYSPELRLQAEPASIPTGQPVSVTVRATDATTGAPVAGRVSIGGRDAGGTNAPFAYTFAAGQTSGTVTATGYPSRTVAFTLYQPVSNAAYVSQSVPTVMVTGERYNVWVRMRNTGTTTWTPGGNTPFRLGSQNPQDNTTWGTNRVALTAPVAPGGEVTFAFTVTAPASPGTWRFQWRMVHELVQWFGGASPDTAVQVSPPTVQASVSPYPVPLNQSVQVTVRAVRNPGGAPVTGDVLVNGTRVAATNSPFTYTFRLRIVGRVFDPETRRYINEYGPPEVVVRAAGYADAGVDLGF